MNIDSIKNGIVLDHIKAGNSMLIYNSLNLDKLDCTVAIIKNVKSSKLGKKDIIKIDAPIKLDFNILGYIDHNITVNIIENGKLKEKKVLSMPESITGIIRCKNPRCITSTEQEIKHTFFLADRENCVYRCVYCESKSSEQF